MRDKEYKEQELYIFLVFQNNYGIFPSLTVEKVKSARKPLFKV